MTPTEKKCPKCGAEAGAPCLGLRGKNAGLPLATGFHAEREQVSPLTPEEERALDADAAALYPPEADQPTEPDQVDVPCAACGKLWSCESSVYPTQDAEEEVPICGACADLPLPEIRELISQRAAAAREWEAKQRSEGEGEGHPVEVTEPTPASAQAVESSAGKSEGEGEGAKNWEDTSRRYLTRNLLCQLADDEIAEKALEVFKIEREIEAIKADAKMEIDPKKDRMGSLKDEIRKGRYEDVRCVAETDWSTNTLTIRRLDIDEVVERRALTAEERQRDLFASPEEQLDRLPRALQAVGVQAEIRNVLHGPRLDRYQLLLGAAKDIKTFTGAQTKLAFELGIEQRLLSWRQGSEPRSLELDVPRAPETWQRFGLSDLRTWVGNVPAGAGLPLCPGVDVLGRPYWLDLARAPHLLVAGATGSGKSVCLHSMLCSLLMTSSPKDVEFYMLDPKRVELRSYAEAPHQVTIVSDRDAMTDQLEELVQLMERRYLDLERLGVRDIDGAHAAGSTMPRIVVVVEELADLVIGGGPAELSLVKLAQKSRAAGIHLLLATQRPDADTFSGLLRSNVDARIALAVQKASESRIILDQDGAESLLKPGDMLIRFGGTVTRAHGLYLSQEEIARVVSGEPTTEPVRTCPADPTCSSYGDGRCATPDGCCSACIVDNCPDDHDHEGVGCPCPEAVRAAERARQGELKGDDLPDEPDQPAEIDDDEPF